MKSRSFYALRKPARPDDRAARRRLSPNRIGRARSRRAGPPAGQADPVRGRRGSRRRLDVLDAVDHRRPDERHPAGSDPAPAVGEHALHGVRPHVPEPAWGR
ncbi:hypothetical protein GCM10025868_45390 [Angustibacter aerolatus]|uniref:Uncharacterized protein n=1 Tax=Angustibacter aerolatus TaxID=1162965 RepID=A0ABQ6JPN9_9ACTN|nr:hypothetical protein GCM10025868_45390 [Angustibacter aerolatus]